MVDSNLVQTVHLLTASAAAGCLNLEHGSPKHSAGYLALNTAVGVVVGVALAVVLTRDWQAAVGIPSVVIEL